MNDDLRAAMLAEIEDVYRGRIIGEREVTANMLIEAFEKERGERLPYRTALDRLRSLERDGKVKSREAKDEKGHKTIAFSMNGGGRAELLRAVIASVPLRLQADDVTKEMIAEQLDVDPRVAKEFMEDLVASGGEWMEVWRRSPGGRNIKAWRRKW